MLQLLGLHREDNGKSSRLCSLRWRGASTASLVPMESGCFGGWYWTTVVLTPTPTWWLAFICILMWQVGMLKLQHPEGHNRPVGVTSASVLMATHRPGAEKAVGWGKGPF